jgi:hypothetical protein
LQSIDALSQLGDCLFQIVDPRPRAIRAYKAHDRQHERHDREREENQAEQSHGESLIG